PPAACAACSSPRAACPRPVRPNSQHHLHGMARFVLRRVLQAIPLIFLVSLAVFSLTWLLPGDPASAIGGVDATPEQVAQIRERLNLDDPAPQRYLKWMGNALTGDFGKSALTERSVSDEIARR